MSTVQPVIHCTKKSSVSNGPLKGNIKWNFGKILLIGKNGQPIDRYGSMTSPTSGKIMAKAIEKALAEGKFILYHAKCLLVYAYVHFS